MNGLIKAVARTGWVFLAAAAMLYGCTSPVGPSQGIEGHWTWVRAFGGIAGIEITPPTLGYTMAVEFASDRVRVFRADTLFAETTVLVEHSDGSGRAGTVTYGDPVFGWPSQEFTLRSGDTLTLADGCCDGFVYTFSRTP